MVEWEPAACGRRQDAVSWFGFPHDVEGLARHLVQVLTSTVDALRRSARDLDVLILSDLHIASAVVCDRFYPQYDRCHWMPKDLVYRSSVPYGVADTTAVCLECGRQADHMDKSA